MNFSTLYKKQLYVIIASIFFSVGGSAQDQNDESTDSPQEEHMVLFIPSPNCFDNFMMGTENQDSSETQNTKESVATSPTEPKEKEEKPLEKKAIDLSRILFPDEIYTYLTQYTIGQD